MTCKETAGRFLHKAPLVSAGFVMLHRKRRRKSRPAKPALRTIHDTHQTHQRKPPMTISAAVLADSISPQGIRLTSFLTVSPRYIQAQILTHRAFSRNAGSSRAIPTKRQLAGTAEDIVRPIRWGRNIPGMQAGEDLPLEAAAECAEIWDDMAAYCRAGVAKLAKIGLAKQWANRPTEWFSDIRNVITATDFANFNALRIHTDAQGEIEALADAMLAARQASTPARLLPGEWHLPYVTDAERAIDGLDTLQRLSVARCARTSYQTAEGRPYTLGEDLALYSRLIERTPRHSTPAEHQATPDTESERYAADGEVISFGWDNRHEHGNLRGFRQLRKMLPNECVRG